MGENASGGRPVLTAAVGAAGVVIAAVIGVVGARSSSGPAGQDTTPTATAGTSTTSTSTTTSSSTAPYTESPTVAAPPHPTPVAATATTDRLRRLLSFVPGNASNCTPVEAPVGALSEVRCTATPKQGQVNAYIWLALYDDLQASRRAFDQIVPASIAPATWDCPEGPDRSDYAIGTQRTAGLLACYVASNNAPYVIWTRDDPGIVAVVAGPVGATLPQVWPVWQGAVINPGDSTA